MNTYRYADHTKDLVKVSGDIKGTVPRTHRFWVEWGVDVAESKGHVKPFKSSTDITKDKETIEREWRDSELKFADIELFKVQDGEGTGLVSDWRNYRKELRDYPQQPSFPYGERPVFINSEASNGN